MTRAMAAELEELAACLDRAERASTAAERAIRRERARELRRLRDRYPGATNAEIRAWAEPCPDCNEDRACESCYAQAHADDNDEFGV